MIDLLKRALTGTIVGAVAGPLVAGLIGALLLALVWLGQGLLVDWPWAEITAAVSWAGVFGILLAPVGAAVGALIGLLVGSLDRFLSPWLGAGSIGGLVATLLTLLVAGPLFGSENFIPYFVAIVAMAISGVLLAIGIKRFIRWLRRRAAQQSEQSE